MNIFGRQGIGYFCVQHDALAVLRALACKLSTVKLYFYLCAHGEIEADANKISKATGLDPDTIATARTELQRSGLIAVRFKPGQGAAHRYTVLSVHNVEPFQPKTSHYGYFQVPRIFVSPRQSAFRDCNGATALVYLSLLAEANRRGTASLKLSKAKIAKTAGLTQKTAVKALNALSSATIPLIRVGQGTAEILNPHTGLAIETALREIEAESQHDDSRLPRTTFSELLTSENYAKYYAEAVQANPTIPQQNLRCPFHDDTRASMSVNLDKGMWYCHACDFGGLIIDLEMRLLNTQDHHTAWKSIAAKLGFSLPRSRRGAVTHAHVYCTADGTSGYRVLRYEDGSASLQTPLQNGKWHRGLKGVKRTIYNASEVQKANLVLIVEGEKKADIISAFGLRDADGLPVAVTCTGSASTWRDEFTKYFVGKRVIVMPDSDEPGERYADSICASLKLAGIEHRVCDFLRFGNDVRDFVKDHSVAELVAYLGADWFYKKNDEIKCSVVRCGKQQKQTAEDAFGEVYGPIPEVTEDTEAEWERHVSA